MLSAAGLAKHVNALGDSARTAIVAVLRIVVVMLMISWMAIAWIGGITGRIGEISAMATSIAASVEQQGAATQEIVRQEVVRQEIVRTVAQAAAGAITGNVAGVASAADETGATASQVLGAVSELPRQSKQVMAEVIRFLAMVRAT